MEIKPIDPKALKEILEKIKPFILKWARKEAQKMFDSIYISCLEEWSSVCDNPELEVANEIAMKYFDIMKKFTDELEGELSSFLYKLDYPKCAYCKYAVKKEGLAHDELWCTKYNIIVSDDDVCKSFERRED